MSKKPYLSIVNHTRYFTRDLRAFAEAHRPRYFKGILIFKHYTPGKNKTFCGEPEFVKMDRNPRDVATVEVGIVKPTRTGRCFNGVPELEHLACMANRTAPQMLRRQLIWRLRVGMCNFRVKDSDYGKYGPDFRDYENPGWFPNPPRLRFSEKDPRPEEISWQKEHNLVSSAVCNLQRRLDITRTAIETKADEIERLKQEREGQQARLERYLHELKDLRRTQALLRLRQPLEEDR